jgi:hypothetical protein
MTCSVAEESELAGLLGGDPAAAQWLCARLYSQQQPTAAVDATVGLDGMFVLFSAYLVFIMCALPPSSLAKKP